MSVTIPEGSLKSDRAVRFGNELKKALKARGVGMRTVSEATGMGRNAVHNWRDGRNLPRIESCRKIAEALDWPRLAELGISLRQKACDVDGVTFLDNSGSDNRRYCSASCQDVAEKRRKGTPAPQRGAAAERRLLVARRAIAAYCNGCEPSGRCVTAECALRPVSPLPLYDGRLDVPIVQPRPHNGYREPGVDSARMRRVWAAYTPEERQARIDRTAERSRQGRGLVAQQ